MTLCPRCGADLSKPECIKIQVKALSFCHMEGSEVIEDSLATKRRGRMQCRECGGRLNKFIVLSKVGTLQK